MRKKKMSYDHEKIFGTFFISVIVLIGGFRTVDFGNM